MPVLSGLAVNNVLLLLDLVIVPEGDLTVARGVIAVGALFVLVAGLVLEDP